jgi:hypothetical protein
VTGPDHYLTAERLLDDAAKLVDSPLKRRQRTAEAQVHATLALAAATALQVRGADAEGWEAVAGREGGAS